MLLMTSWCLFCSQRMSFGQKLLQLVFDKSAKRATCEFFKFGFIFAACWIRT